MYSYFRLGIGIVSLEVDFEDFQPLLIPFRRDLSSYDDNHNVCLDLPLKPEFVFQPKV